MTYNLKTLCSFVAVGALLTACSSGKDAGYSGYGMSAQGNYHSGSTYQVAPDAPHTYNSASYHTGQWAAQGCAPQPSYASSYPCASAQSQYQYSAPQPAQSQYGYGTSHNTGYSQNGYAHMSGYGAGYGAGHGGSYYGQSTSRGPRQYPSTGVNYSGRGSALSYESLNAFEAPVATEIAGVTFELRGRMDSVTDYSLENGGDPNHRLVGSHRVTAVKQLPNRYTIGATFTGRANDIGNGDSDYTPRIRGFVGGSWGTFFGGSVQDITYENTRRLRGAGRNVGMGPREETLHGEGSQGRLADWGGAYQGRYGPTTVTAVVDEDANYDVGVKFQRPIGNKDYRFTARHNTGTFLAADGVTEIETKAVTGVAEYVYGSTRYDISGGVEQYETAGDTADRWFTSAGVTTKRGVWSLTAEGLYGQVEGQDETSAFLGVKYDIARGLSATAAVDYQDRSVSVGGTNIVDVKDTRALMGLSYGF